MEQEDPKTFLAKIKKYPDFVLEQSDNISYDNICYAEKHVPRID